MVISCDYFLKGDKKAKEFMNKEYIKTLCGDVITDLEWTEK